MFFSFIISCQHKGTDRWRKKKNRQARKTTGKEDICAYETQIVVIATQFWKERLRSRNVLYLIDNEVSQGQLQSGYSTNPKYVSILNGFWSLNAQERINFWIGRVPTDLNWADRPSRGLFPYSQYGFQLVQILCS